MCNIHTLNHNGHSLLHYAVQYDQVGSTEMARLLLDRRDQDPNVTVPYSSRSDEEGLTPLCFALHNPKTRKDFPDAAWFVNVDPDAVNLLGETPLDTQKNTARKNPHLKNNASFPFLLDEIRDLRSLRQATSTETVEDVWSDVGDGSDEDENFEDAVEVL
ncbi:hypothetical protein F503_07758 [Ophiostoma piceae UAMH 11346]|uniref:Ankyrin repeat protein n=1 Tax=Ophiostoma piceae (strain UAMH 11346) TaxID=1262450 RepID=S3C2V6_OPHP1|nr:hypothetical protein F503_07758 [Ophiostoma piceae UAMH 11346]